jgi:hypothetical protein
MTTFELQRRTQAFRMGYWDGCASRWHDEPPFVVQATRDEYAAGVMAARLSRIAEKYGA